MDKNEKRISEIEKSLQKMRDLEVALKIGRNEKTGYLNIDPQSIKISSQQTISSTNKPL